MRARSEQWFKLAARGRFKMEAKARIGGVDYTAISAPKIDRSLMDSALSVGNCISATLSLSIMTEDNIPATAPIVIMGRLTDGTIYSEWKEFGTFYINNRDTSYVGLLRIDCFDAMLKASQNYITGTESEVAFPKPMITAVREIAERIGVGIDPRTKIRTGADYVIPFPSGLTMMQVLGYIGACHGGNWIITEENLLRLVPLVSAPDETFHIINEDFETIQTVEGDQLAYMQKVYRNAVLPPPVGEIPPSSISVTHYIIDENGSKIVTSDGHILIWTEAGTIDAEDGLIDIPVVCGDLNTGKKVLVTGVVMTDDAGNTYTAGNDSGVRLSIEGNPYATQNICNDLNTAFNGLVCMPYTATKTIYDPATELGDQARIGDLVHSVLYHSTLSFDVNFRADIASPDSEELNTEYPYLSETKKTEILINKVKERSEVLFQVNADSITAELNRATEAEGALSSRITQTAEGISTEVSRAQGAESALSSRITQTAESITSEVSRATAAEGTLSSRITQTAEEISTAITAETTRAEGVESTLSSRITQTAESISTEITAETTRAQGAESALSSRITQTAESISTEITAETTRATGAESSLSSRITQNANSITAEITRAEGAESSLSTRITQTANSVSSEVSRATTAEGSLSTRITQTADSVTSEVSRATAAEGSLSSRITQNANAISLKVDSGSVSSELSLENGNVTIESNRLLVSSTNFSLSRNGTVVANNIQAEGSLVSSNSSTGTKTRITDGAVKFYDGDTLTGRVASGVIALGEGDSGHQVVDLETNSEGIIFSVGSTYFFALNNGLNTGGSTERFLAMCDSRFRDTVHLSDNLMFDAGDPYGGNTNTLFLSNGTLCTHGGIYVGSDLTVIGSKNRAVETEHYGHRALNAMESAAAVFSDMGSGVIDETGICEVYFDPCFAETIDSRSDYLVFTTQTGAGAIGYVEKSEGYFTVTGHPGTPFDWIIYAKQKGYANTYLETVDVPEYSESETDDSVFMGDNNGSVISEDYMGEFVDTLDEDAEQYLAEYEKEVLGYGD